MGYRGGPESEDDRFLQAHRRPVRPSELERLFVQPIVHEPEGPFVNALFEAIEGMVNVLGWRRVRPPRLGRR